MPIFIGQDSLDLVSPLYAAGIARENATLQSAVEIAQRVVDSDREKLDRIKTDLATKAISLENARAPDR